MPFPLPLLSLFRRDPGTTSGINSNLRVKASGAPHSVTGLASSTRPSLYSHHISKKKVDLRPPKSTLDACDYSWCFYHLKFTSCYSWWYITKHNDNVTTKLSMRFSSTETNINHQCKLCKCFLKYGRISYVTIQSPYQGHN